MSEPVEPVERETDDGAGLDALADLLRELRAYPVLDHAEHLSLIAAAQAGDSAAMERMVQHNLRLVVSMVKRYNGCGVDSLDLIQEGSFGLMRAIQKYRLDSGNQFSTYATWWIRQAIMRAVENLGRTIRLPSYRVLEMRRITRQYENEPEAREQALQALDWWRDDATSLDARVHPHEPGEETTRGDLIASSESAPDELVTERATNEQLLVALFNRAGLSGRELAVIALRYGLGGHETHTLEAIAPLLPRSRQNGKPLTHERIRQIELAALRKLRAAASCASQETRDALLAQVA